MSAKENLKSILFISELPDNIIDPELKTFFSDYEQDIYMLQVDHNQKLHDRFNTRKPRAIIYFKDPLKAKEAREKLKNSGLNIKIEGEGGKIISQEPQAEKAVEQGTVIDVVLESKEE